MKLKKNIYAALMVIVTIFNFQFHAFSEEEQLPIITNVKISGNSAISNSLINQQLSTRKGKKFSRIDVTNDIKRLYQTNYFSKIDVDISEEGNKFEVIFLVQEKPIVKKIIFKGNSKFKDKKLMSEISLRVGSILNEKIIMNDVTKILNFYEKKGFYKIEVTHEIISNESTSSVDIVFNIREGDKIKIKKINILGTYHIKEKKILGIIKTKKNKWYNSGIFEEEKFSEDLERIKAYYYQLGYIDIKILDVKKSYLDNGKLIIDISVSEGSQYRVGNIVINGNKEFSTDELAKSIKQKNYDTYLPENLSKDLQSIKNIYLKNGYMDSVVSAKPFSSGENILDINYSIVENEKSFIDKIRIIGNSKTKDIVVRRELNLEPGNEFDGVKMQIAEKRLVNSGLFKNVDVYPDPSIKDKNRDLIVEVEEDRTGELGFGAGYSSVDKLVGFFEISQSNFDILNWPSFTGDAQKLKFRTEFGSLKQEFSLDFTEPWMFGKRLLFGTKLYTLSREYETSDYSEDRDGITLRLAKPIFKYSRAELRYSFETVEINNISDGASEYFKAQEGAREIGKIGFKISRDVRDSYFAAMQGSKISLDTEVAGVGGDIYYYRGVISTDLYFNPFFNHVLITSLRVGGIKEYGDTDEVPIFEKFFLGGAWSVRGFDYRDIGPHDELDEPMGGNFMYHATFEYVIPLIEQIRFATFVDFGNLYSTFDDIDFDVVNASYGIGMRIMINERVPLRFDYAWPFETDEYHKDAGGQFTFDIGQRF